MPRQGQYTDAQVKVTLDGYVKPRECASTPMPRDLKPEMVADYVRSAVTADLGYMQMDRAMRLVRFYVLRDSIDHLAGFLAGRERTPADLERSCRVIVAVAELGTPEQQQGAVKQFQRLVDTPPARQRLALLIDTFFSLPARTPPEALKARVRTLREEVAKNGPQEDLGVLMDYDLRELPWMLEEKGRKDSIPQIKDDATRRRKWAEMYLGFDQKTPYRWDEQAGFYFLADVRSAGDEPAVAALRAAMSRIDPNKDNPDLVKLRKTRGYRARQYFLETLDEKSERDRQANLRPQDDLIM